MPSIPTKQFTNFEGKDRTRASAGQPGIALIVVAMAESSTSPRVETSVDEEAESTTVAIQLGGRADKDALVEDGGSPASMSATATGGLKACIFIIGCEISERLTYYGISSNLITYLTTVLHESTSSAAKSVNYWSGVTALTPLVGGFIADAYLGRYWTILIVSGVYILGSLLLTLSASVSGLKPPRCNIPTGSPCPKPRAGQVGAFYFSLYLISVGTGGLKPNLEALGADQFDEQNPAEKLAKNSFFNWWFFGLNIGGMASSTVLIYIEDNVGWGWGFGVPAIAIAIAVVAFCIGTPFYRQKTARLGSPLSSVAQVLVASARKWNIDVPTDKSKLYQPNNKNAAQVEGRRLQQLSHTKDFVFLDKAAVVGLHEDVDANTNNPWRLCTVTQVEEVKLILRVMPIWTTSLAYVLVHAQIATFFTKQGATLDNNIGHHFKIPPASMQIILGIIIFLFLPVYDRFLVPFFRKFTKNVRGISLLQRLGVGLFLSIMCMIVAALTESKRLKLAKHHGLLHKPFILVPMSIFELSPQYALFGFADVFFVVGLQEFFYDQMPDTMRSMAIGLYLSVFGIGSFLSSLCITIVNSVSAHGNNNGWISNNLNMSHLDFFYWFVGVLGFINFLIFLLVSNWYKYKHEVDATERNSSELGIQLKHHPVTKSEIYSSHGVHNDTKRG